MKFTIILLFCLVIFSCTDTTGKYCSRRTYTLRFRPGDVVILRSGGHKMVVSSYGDDFNDYTCKWMVDGKIKEDDFDDIELEPYKFSWMGKTK